MKNKLKIFTVLAVGILFLHACQKDPDLRMPDLTMGVLPLIKKDVTKDPVIFDNDIAGFAGSVTLDLYYPDKPKSISLMVSMNDDPDNSAAAIADVKTFPVTYDFTIADLVALLPGINNASEIETNDFFHFYADITLEDGTVINGNDPFYTAYSAAIANLPGSSTDVVFPVVCGYEPSLAWGSYFVASSGGWGSSGNITITIDPDDNTTVYVVGLEEIEGLTEDVGPLVMHINPVTFEVIADKSVLASDAWGYTNIAYEGKGTFNSCDGTYVMNFKITVDQGSFGSWKFELVRN